MLLFHQTNNNNNNNNNIMDSLSNPLNFTQIELMEKFNLAFYEGQNQSKTSNLLSTLEPSEIKDDYLIDYLMSSSTHTSEQNSSTEFDFNDFVDIFDRNLNETCNLAEDSQSDDDELQQGTTEPLLDILDLNNIELSNHFYDENFDLDNLTNSFIKENNHFESFLPPINTITKNNYDFNQYIRGLPNSDLNYYQTNDQPESEFGHLLQNYQHFEETNQVVLTQKEALIEESIQSSELLRIKRQRNYSESDETDQELDVDRQKDDFICQWENCYKFCETQTGLVRHIEKFHVEIKRGDEFTCFWSNCPRKIKPFNARYKLLIHMRVHSGEKPNKCPFQGCNKAFSRLENLKIHQRSHTGERPYLCQFPTCTKSFSNSSDRAKHQRTHFDTKPYACQVVGCMKKYTDPSSLRKHVKNHTNEEQMLIKRKSNDDATTFNTNCIRKYLDLNRQKAIKTNYQVEHNYSNNNNNNKNTYYNSCNNKNLINIKQDLKNKISQKNKLRKASF